MDVLYLSIPILCHSTLHFRGRYYVFLLQYINLLATAVVARYFAVYQLAYWLHMDKIPHCVFVVFLC